jgi:hypothetical protein
VAARDHEAPDQSDHADCGNDQDPHRVKAADVRHCDNREHRSGDDGVSDRRAMSTTVTTIWARAQKAGMRRRSNPTCSPVAEVIAGEHTDGESFSGFEARSKWLRCLAVRRLRSPLGPLCVHPAEAMGPGRPPPDLTVETIGGLYAESGCIRQRPAITSRAKLTERHSHISGGVSGDRAWLVRRITGDVTRGALRRCAMSCLRCVWRWRCRASRRRPIDFRSPGRSAAAAQRHSGVRKVRNRGR